MIERLYVDREMWEGRHVVSHHGLIATRAERSTIGHLPYHYLWFAREAREGGRCREALEYLMRITADPARYDAATTDFAVWHELALVGARVNRRAGAAALEELIRRSDRQETRRGLLRHADALRACAAEYDRPGLTAALDDAIDRARRAAGPCARAGTGDA
jgi:hypothetical protein